MQSAQSIGVVSPAASRWRIWELKSVK
jgi:hypothetical protein